MALWWLDAIARSNTLGARDSAKCQSREVIANRGRFAQVSPPYMGRFHGMANS
ncbi:hypothetical protein KIN20_020615 [Parelaphostrongylus tenuis]|uniref:Uncharacterized protein n=1 Tax=Parelaphostrongylus tenuis TaxID=148309 RepID=A0AAD5N6X1_PARTN|nr:hypothetical protein KIN20_020615 [Parelaphostrongylus tenuis]